MKLNLLVNVFRHTCLVEQLTPTQWDLLIRLARRSNLLSTLAFMLRENDNFEQVPVAPKAHLESAILMAEEQHRAALWEVECIREALGDLNAPRVLLKGAAYLADGIPMSKGRIFSDIDILVPKPYIICAESKLKDHGWVGANPDDTYYQRYYREWMHEIPPMQHSKRGTSLDLHHSILPETARIGIPAQKLFSNLKPLRNYAGISILSGEDLVLHSATHLFHEGELGNGIRDLLDFHRLLAYFAKKDDSFWDLLILRATELGLNRPLWYALRYTRMIFGTTIPIGIRQRAETGRPGYLTQCLMDFCYLRALQPDHASCDTRFTWLARTLVYFRSHWIRMPVHLLVYHLGRKFLQGLIIREK